MRGHLLWPLVYSNKVFQLQLDQSGPVRYVLVRQPLNNPVQHSIAARPAALAQKESEACRSDGNSCEIHLYLQFELKLQQQMPAT
jgi:hypothetical protein